MEVLNKLSPIEEVLKLVHLFINELVWSKPPEFEHYRSIFTSKEWSSFKLEFNKLKEACQADGFAKSIVLKYLADLPEDRKPTIEIQTAIAECFETRKEELHKYLLSETDSITGVGNVLKDIDWSVNVVMASDTMGSLRQPLLNLTLHMEGDEGRNTEQLELSHDELKMLITSMDAAYKSSLQML
ncbi:COMM domain-containing protein 8 [Oopsacas minuta]|uniref:COMM domain-containing protein 8 n=1 Tax=Oopsacas minuta TaxID=111878 RepID=A0AAV7K8Y9_9METZ|nr:COMM domain-containing protein 8 [Oopsacas minuta]